MSVTEDLAARAIEEARALVPGLVRDERSRVRRSIKCVLVPALSEDGPLMVKALTSRSKLFAWYLAREQVVYEQSQVREALAPSGVTTPRLVASSDRMLVTDRLPGKPLARRRHELEGGLPRHPRSPTIWARLVEVVRAIERVDQERVATTRRTDAVTREMRRRLLEDPDMPMEWVTEGLARGADLGILEPSVALHVSRVFERHFAVTFGHGDLLPRNILAELDGALAIVDWECAGAYPRGWDAALLWIWAPPETRGALERSYSGPLFSCLVTFALVREIAFRSASGEDGIRARLTSELPHVLDRIP